MKRTRQERAVAVTVKRPSEPRVVVRYAPRPEALDGIAEAILALLDERARSGRV